MMSNFRLEPLISYYLFLSDIRTAMSRSLFVARLCSNLSLIGLHLHILEVVHKT